MKTYTKEELALIIQNHALWLEDSSKGCRANLSSADLGYANLSSANLSSANLSYANLSSANLSSADLSYANLRYANLRYADLGYANLSSANLSSADLRYANLSSADLRYANLGYADLSSIKDDYISKLTMQKDEVVGLYKAILSGKIDGSTYSGECACFVGTIANIKGVKKEELSCNVNSESPTEKFFFGIAKGDTPDNNSVSAVVKDWTIEFMKENEITIPEMVIEWK